MTPSGYPRATVASSDMIRSSSHFHGPLEVGKLDLARPRLGHQFTEIDRISLEKHADLISR